MRGRGKLYVAHEIPLGSLHPVAYPFGKARLCSIGAHILIMVACYNKIRCWSSKSVSVAIERLTVHVGHCKGVWLQIPNIASATWSSLYCIYHTLLIPFWRTLSCKQDEKAALPSRNLLFNGLSQYKVLWQGRTVPASKHVNSQNNQTTILPSAHPSQLPTWLVQLACKCASHNNSWT